MRLGILGGTFDPIHNGHIRLAIEAYERCALDQLLFVPTPSPQHKPPPKARYEQRCCMIKEAIEPFNFFALYPLPTEPSFDFAVHIIDKIRADFNANHSLFFLLGHDSFATLHTWHQWQNLCRTCQFIVFDRQLGPSLIKTSSEITKQIGEQKTLEQLTSNPSTPGWTQVNSPMLSITATYIREAIENNRRIDGLVPQVAQAYIQKNNLYQASHS